MSLPSTSIKRPVTVTMFYVGVALPGIFAFPKGMFHSRALACCKQVGVDLLSDYIDICLRISKEA